MFVILLSLASFSSLAIVTPQHSNYLPHLYLTLSIKEHSLYPISTLIKRMRILTVYQIMALVLHQHIQAQPLYISEETKENLILTGCLVGPALVGAAIVGGVSLTTGARSYGKIFINLKQVLPKS